MWCNIQTKVIYRGKIRYFIKYAIYNINCYICFALVIDHYIECYISSAFPISLRNLFFVANNFSQPFSGDILIEKPDHFLLAIEKGLTIIQFFVEVCVVFAEIYFRRGN